MPHLTTPDVCNWIRKWQCDRVTRLFVFCLPLVAAVLLLLAAVFFPAPAAAGGNWRYFPETGCWVGNEFLDYFDSRGGLDIFGYPLTNAEDQGSLRIQYFQRARMELRADAPAAYRVQLGLLGQELRGLIDPPVDPGRIPSPRDPHQRYFPETGQVVAYAFLDLLQSQRRPGHLRLPHHRRVQRERRHRPVLSAGAHGVAAGQPAGQPRPARPAGRRVPRPTHPGAAHADPDAGAHSRPGPRPRPCRPPPPRRRP